jgi:nitric oxide dioxygenase
MSLTPGQVSIIKATVPAVRDHGQDVTALFYKNLFSDRPEMHNVFNQTHQENGRQAQALAASLFAYASNIDDLGALTPAVEKICQKHASLFIQPAQYTVVGEGLLRAMGDVLGDAFTEEVQDAWLAAYWQLANIMMNRESQLYDAAAGWRDWRDFTIAKKVQESNEITSFYLQPADGEPLPPYLPGQYISLRMDVPHFGYQQSRQYSLSDAPNPKNYRISVKKESGYPSASASTSHRAGWISTILHDETRIGDMIQVSPPSGDFFHNPSSSSSSDSSPIVLLSAGVGITPMISILNTTLLTHPSHPISFIHGSRNPSAQAFAPHIRHQVSTHAHVTATLFVNTPAPTTDDDDDDNTFRGRLTLSHLLQVRKPALHLDDARTRYFVCGPETFMADFVTGLKAAGVDEGRIQVELFGTGEAPR